MTDFPQIFNTEIINAETDVFWHKEEVSAQSERQYATVIITNSLQPGSAEEVQLNKIIEACKIPAEDYYILQLQNNEQRAWHTIKQSFQPLQLITFGIPPSRLGIASLFRLHAVNHFDSSVIIPALSLQELEQNPQAKKDLWLNALKPVFADK